MKVLTSSKYHTNSLVLRYNSPEHNSRTFIIFNRITTGDFPSTVLKLSFFVYPKYLRELTRGNQKMQDLVKRSFTRSCFILKNECLRGTAWSEFCRVYHYLHVAPLTLLNSLHNRRNVCRLVPSCENLNNLTCAGQSKFFKLRSF